jgi:uncharacterized protein YegP (UPF0339 family)
MAGKFELKKASDGQFYFNLKASNGKVILTSERYTEKRNAQKGAESVRKNAANDARFERKQNTGGQPYFILKASNGETIGRSETYSGTSGVTRGIASVKKTASDAAVDDQTA